MTIMYYGIKEVMHFCKKQATGKRLLNHWTIIATSHKKISISELECWYLFWNPKSQGTKVNCSVPAQILKILPVKEGTPTWEEVPWRAPTLSNTWRSKLSVYPISLFIGHHTAHSHSFDNVYLRSIHSARHYSRYLGHLTWNKLTSYLIFPFETLFLSTLKLCSLLEIVM